MRALFSCDADGNLTRDGRWLYTWDGENRLLRVRMRDDVGAQSGIVRFGIDNTYDSQGRRVGYVESIFSSPIGWAPFIEKFFLYDGWNLLREDVEIGGHNRHFVWGTDISGSMQGAGGVGGLLWAMDGGQTHAAGYDANGNIIAWANTADGTLSGTREYGAFGENIASTGVGVVDKMFGIPFGFSTKYQDRLAGHYYYGYRFYDTNTGRWLSKDPIREPGGLNLYAFVGNNGVNRWDLLGMAPADLLGAMYSATEKHKETADAAARSALRKMLLGTDTASLHFGKDHFWTAAIRSHAHMNKVRANIIKGIYGCGDPQFVVGESTEHSFGVSSLGILGNGVAIIRDFLSIFGITDMDLSIGSFRLGYVVNSVDRENCEADVDFSAYDAFRLGSLTRIPFTDKSILQYAVAGSIYGTAIEESLSPGMYDVLNDLERGKSNVVDQPFGPNAPLNTVSLSWVWHEIVRN